jgi:hypothetical protein
MRTGLGHRALAAAAAVMMIAAGVTAACTGGDPDLEGPQDSGTAADGASSGSDGTTTTDGAQPTNDAGGGDATNVGPRAISCGSNVCTGDHVCCGAHEPSDASCTAPAACPSSTASILTCDNAADCPAEKPICCGSVISDMLPDATFYVSSTCTTASTCDPGASDLVLCQLGDTCDSGSGCTSTTAPEYRPFLRYCP